MLAVTTDFTLKRHVGEYFPNAAIVRHSIVSKLEIIIAISGNYPPLVVVCILFFGGKHALPYISRREQLRHALVSSLGMVLSRA
jgi:hypothetical protein